MDPQFLGKNDLPQLSSSNFDSHSQLNEQRIRTIHLLKELDTTFTSHTDRTDHTARTPFAGPLQLRALTQRQQLLLLLLPLLLLHHKAFTFCNVHISSTSDAGISIARLNGASRNRKTYNHALHRLSRSSGRLWRIMPAKYLSLFDACEPSPSSTDDVSVRP